MNARRSLVAVALAIGATGTTAAAQAQDDAPPTAKVSVGSGGEEANRSSSAGADATYGDGRYVVFSSRASNLIRGERTGGVFVRDTLRARTTRIAENGGTPAVSADGRVVAYYVSRASCNRLVVLDRRTGARRLVPMTRRNPREPDLTVGDYRLSPDGRYVVSMTGRTGFGQSCAEAARDEERDEGPQAFVLELFDRRTGEVRRIRGRGLNVSHGDGMAVSRNARIVAVASKRTPTSFFTDVVAIDTRTGRHAVVSVDSEGRNPARHRGRSPDITPDGRYVAFESNAQLAPEDVGENPQGEPSEDVYVRDLRRQTTELASAATDGGDLRDSHGPSISANGRHVAFASVANGLSPRHLFVRDVAEDQTRFVAPGQAAAVADLSPDGGTLVFTLYPGRFDEDSARVQEVYMAHLRP